MTPMMLTTPTLATDVRNDALRLLSNGLYILTVCAGDTVHAATISWVTQASFEPPLVLLALKRNSHLALAVRKAHRFALNIVSAEQMALAEKFFAHQTAAADAKDLGGFPLRIGATLCPLLTDALGWLECRLAAEPTTPGDHVLLLGEVTAAGVRRQDAPLVLWGTPWAYGGLREP